MTEGSFGARSRNTDENRGDAVSDESGQKKLDKEVDALEEEQPTQEFRHQISGEEWHGDAADQANDLREYEEEAEIRAQSGHTGDVKK